jgi:hypothetical protein
MEATAPDNGPAPQPRRWYQFRAQTGWLVALLAGCCLVAIGGKAFEARRQQTAVAALQRSGGEVYYDYEFDRQGLYVANTPAPGPAWLHSVLGDDIFRNVHWVSLEGPGVTDEVLKNLEGLSRLQWLSIKSAPGVTDAGLDHLRGLHELDELYLYGTAVTPTGMAKLQIGLPQCHLNR